MHDFSYRSPRIVCRLPVELVADAGALLGWSRNLSDEGMLVDFQEPLLPSTQGRVRLRFGQCLLELEGRVTHTEAFTAGIAFLFADERERWFVHSLVQALEAAQHVTVSSR